MVHGSMMQCDRHAWDVVTRTAVEDLLEFLREALLESENQWDAIKGSRQDCMPYDVYNAGFWNGTDPSQWKAAMTVCTWAKAKRQDVVEMARNRKHLQSLQQTD